MPLTMCPSLYTPHHAEALPGQDGLSLVGTVTPLSPPCQQRDDSPTPKNDSQGISQPLFPFHIDYPLTRSRLLLLPSCIWVGAGVLETPSPISSSTHTRQQGDIPDWKVLGLVP